MDKETKLVKKVRRLLRRLGCPRWLHRYGPKTYEFIEHLSALVVRWYARLSYRRTKTLLDLLGIRCPGKSSLNRTSRKQASGIHCMDYGETAPSMTGAKGEKPVTRSEAEIRDRA